ncbi:hypothetical protein TSL6_17790 [Sulfurovum sp. TSL6]|uniref:hypothetical protein n=1 Tax=Sulfurovum sp. TSL6 TaxID=2826995 RepID=UPI001CC47858|nr:hypothetical protein [Sulfurovum sp. TSL6]GIU01273.1 hypothetical protein TSL6_17790 [Sulfurovum sp. TSL6]
MLGTEPTLDNIEDYKAQGSTEKRLIVWIVILSGLLVGAIYGMLIANSSVSDALVIKEPIGIFK